MGRYELSVEVPLNPDDAYRLWTDTGRYPQWQVGLLRVAEATGRADQVGTTLRLDFGPGLKRTTRVVEVDPPRRYVVEEDGLRSRNRTAARFEPIAHGTCITVTYDLEVQLGPVSGILEKLTRGGTFKTGRKELDRFAALASRPFADPIAGRLYSVDAFAAFRAIKVLAINDEVVHVALLPGASKVRPDDVAEIPDIESRPIDPLGLRPLEPSLRRTASTAVVGQPLLALDGGAGVPHLAMTIAAFTDALPEPIASAPVFPEEAAEVESWHRADGPILDRDIGTTIVPLVSVKEGGRYAIAKLLHVERRGVHVRLYADRYDIPPDDLNPWTLRLDRHDAPTFSYGHMPLSRGTLAAMEPAYQRLTMRSPSELDGYEMWKEAGGGFF